MRHAVAVGILIVGAIILIAFRMLYSPSDHRVREGESVKAYLLRTQDKKSVTNNANKTERHEVIKRESIPVLLEYAMNREVPDSQRREALLLLEETNDERVIKSIFRYYQECREEIVAPCYMEYEMSKVLASYYRRTSDKRILTCFDQMLIDDGWSLLFKGIAIKALASCQDAASRQILKDHVMNNGNYINVEHKAWAAKAVVLGGDQSAIALIVEYAGYILDTDYDKDQIAAGRSFAALEGMKTLSVLAQTMEPANRALIDIGYKFIFDNDIHYIYRDGDIEGFGQYLLPAIASVGREENIRIVEKYIGASMNEMIVNSGISALRDYGDESSIRYLSQFAGKGKECQEAIMEIKKRLKDQKKR